MQNLLEALFRAAGVLSVEFFGLTMGTVTVRSRRGTQGGIDFEAFDAEAVKRLLVEINQYFDQA